MSLMQERKRAGAVMAALGRIPGGYCDLRRSEELYALLQAREV